MIAHILVESYSFSHYARGSSLLELCVICAPEVVSTIKYCKAPQGAFILHPRASYYSPCDEHTRTTYVGIEIDSRDLEDGIDRLVRFSKERKCED